MAEYDLISKTALLRHLDMAIDCKDCPRNTDRKTYYERCACSEVADICNTITDFATFADVQPVNQWISCKDKMPDTPEQGMDAKYSDCCLVCDDFGWIGMGYYMTDGKKSWWEFADAQNKIKIDWTEITHWMPLPKPPKEGTE